MNDAKSIVAEASSESEWEPEPKKAKVSQKKDTKKEPSKRKAVSKKGDKGVCACVIQHVCGWYVFVVSLLQSCLFSMFVGVFAVLKFPFFLNIECRSFRVSVSLRACHVCSRVTDDLVDEVETNVNFGKFTPENGDPPTKLPFAICIRCSRKRYPCVRCGYKMYLREIPFMELHAECPGAAAIQPECWPCLDIAD